MRTTFGPILATLALTSLAAAQVPAPPDVNDAEFKCMYSSAKAEAKFVPAKAKCVSKCFANFWKGLTPVADCTAPYGGSTARCIDDATFLRGADNRFEAAMKKSCVLASWADCPECYSGGDCTAMSVDRVESRGNVVDAFIPGIFCETTGAEDEEQRCELQTAKTLARYYAASMTCYARCFADARSNARPLEECLPPVANSRWFGCLTSVRAKAEATMHKYCHDTSTPLATPECPGQGYPDEVQWADLMDTAVEGFLPENFCAE